MNQKKRKEYLMNQNRNLFGCTGLLAELGILRTQAWRHGSRAWGSLFSAAGRRTTTLRLRRRSTPAPPSLFLAALAAGRGATRAGPRWARSGSGLTTVTVPGRLSGRAGCHSRPGRDRLRAGSGSLCSPLSFAGRRAGVRPTPGSRLSPGTLAGALDPLRRFAPSGTGASRRVLTGVASGPGLSRVDRQGHHLSQGAFDPGITAVTWDARWRTGSSPALRSVGNRRQSPRAHGCRVRARAVVCGPPGAPSQSGATSLDGPVLRAHLGRRRRA